MPQPKAKKIKLSLESEITSRRCDSPIHTPQQSPQKKVVRITEAQKQALIENLRLEVTERARKLRAQYAMQAQSLRSRVEFRVNRIPMALRNVNMGDLFASHQRGIAPAQQPHLAEHGSESEKRAPQGIMQPTKSERMGQSYSTAPQSRGMKRKSDALDGPLRAKSSEPITIHEDPIPIPNPKTRTKKTGGASRPMATTTAVLSPKSANSRNFPQSPLKGGHGATGAALKVQHATSPLKPASTMAKSATAALAGMLGEKAKPGRPRGGLAAAKTTAGKTVKETRAPAVSKITSESEGLRTISSTSDSSAFSTGTTIVKAGTRQYGGATKKPIGSINKAAGKRVAAAVATAAGTETAPSTAGRRQLRKR